jgi:hypothetical protein
MRTAPFSGTRPAHLSDMSTHTIATPITTWAELRNSDRELLDRSEVAARLTLARRQEYVRPRRPPPHDGSCGSDWGTGWRLGRWS